MLQNPTALKTMSLLSRYTAENHSIIGVNIAHTDTPGVSEKTLSPFHTVIDELAAGTTLKSVDTRKPIVLDNQMRLLAENASRHEAATTLWKKTLDLVKTAASAPR